MTHHPIGDLAFVSDMHSAALIDRDGTVAWLSFPRFDSPSVFGSLLGEEAGRWRIRPVGDAEVTRRYLPDSLVLETTFTTPRGTAVLTDALALAPDDDDALLGAGAPHALLRRIRVEQGEVDVMVDFVPRPEYGLAYPLLRRDGDTITTTGSPAALSLSTSVTLEVATGLTFQPTGAIVAAATTSLPEVIGGERNWDYRYSWVRDASLTLRALWVAACPAEADAFLRFLVDASAADLRRGGDLQIMYGVGGEHDLNERVLEHLPGWRDSRPVRVGNGAWDQRQLDVYGELLEATSRLQHQIGDLDVGSRDFLVACAEVAADSWMQADEGIWEVRGGAQHFVHSKLMCWVALDRAIAMAGWLGAEEHVERWERVRAQIRRAILDRGWSDTAGSFTQAFDSDILDASVLMMPIMGFLPADDQRMQATMGAIEERLTDAQGLVYRYEGSTDDGLEGEEGTFLLCTFWLAYCHALAGDVGRAREVFERAIAFRNDLGLLSEEVDAGSGELIGNFPQAFSHVGLVNAAWAIHEAESGMR